MTRSRTVFLLALAAPFAHAAAARAQAQAEPVAIVMRVTGAVRVHSPGGRPSSAGPGTRLRPGTRVLVPAGGQALILYRTGRIEALTRDKVIAAPAGAARPGIFRQTVRTLGEVTAVNARAQPNRQGMIRPVAGAAVPVEPRNGAVLLAGRLTLAWLAIPGGSAYTVQIRPLAGGPVRRFDAGTDTVWTLPPAEAALRPGAEYEWSVQAEGGRAAQPQRFRVASRAAADSVAAGLAELRRMGLDPAGDGAFAAALLYRGAGMLYEARRALERMQALGTATGPEYHLLAYDVHNALGQADLAQADWAAWRAATGAAP